MRLINTLRYSTLTGLFRRCAVSLLLMLLSGAASAGWMPVAGGAGQASVPVPNHPGAVVLAASARVLVTATADKPTLVVLNPENGQQVASITLQSRPRAVVVDDNGGSAYVIYESSGNVAAVDLAGGVVRGNWTVGKKLSALALMPGGNELLVSDRDARKLIAVDTRTGAVTRSQSLSVVPQQLAVGANGLRALVGHAGGLLVLDAATLGEMRNVAAGETKAVGWWSNGGVAVTIARYPGAFNLIDIDKGTLIGSTPLPNDARALGFDPVQDKAYIGTEEDIGVYRIDLRTLTMDGRYNLPARSGGIVWDGVSQTLIVSQPLDNALVQLDPAAAVLTPVVLLSNEPRGIAVDNAAHQAFVIAAKPDQANVIALADKRLKSLPISAKLYRVSLDDTRRLAIVAAKGSGGHQLLFIDLATQTLLPERIAIGGEVRALATDASRGITLVLLEEGLVVVDNATRAQTGTVALPGNEYRDVAIHSTRGIAYLVAESTGQLLPLDIASRALQPAVALPFAPRRIAVDDMLDIAVISEEESSRVHLLNLANGQFSQPHTLAEYPGAIAIHPDTHTAVVLSRKANQLSLIDLAGNVLTGNFAAVPQPFALGISIRDNQALVLSSEGSNISFIQLPNPQPVLGDIAPGEILQGSAAFKLKVTGKHFTGKSKVRFGADLLTTRWVSLNELEADVPAALLNAAKLVSVTVETPAPGGGTSQPVTFRVLNPAPVLSSVNPAQLIAFGKGQSLAVTGSNFMQGSQIFFGAQALPTTYVSATQLNAQVPDTLLTASGTVPLTVFTPTPGGGASAALQVVVRNATPTVTAFTPASGPVGTAVSITGTNFDTITPGANTVSFNGQRAVVNRVTATQLDVVVPVRATTGPVTVATQSGSATSTTAFTVQSQEDFDIALSAATAEVPPGGNGSIRIKLASTGLIPYAQTVGLSVTGLPAGVTYSVDRASLYLNQDVILTFSAAPGTAAGSYPVSIVGSGPVDLQSLTRSQPLALTVLAAGGTTVSGRVLHAEDDTPFVGAQIRLGTQAVLTDASGYYRFVNPGILGEQVIQIDGHTNATAAVQYPSAIAMPVLITAGQDNIALTSYIQGIDTTKFTAITPAAETHVTVPEIPNYELRIPAGAVLKGWDGTPVTKVNVRTVAVDKLPIKPLPPGVSTNTVYLYYFFRQGGATPSRPIPVTMSNDLGALPGEKIDLWYYDESVTPDPNSNQWRIMGQGTVSQDGKSIVSDPGVGIPKFCCGASFASRGNAGSGNNGPDGGDGCGPTAGNPVDLATGNASVFEMRSFGINSLIPVNLSCRYRSTNPQVGAFGRGTSFGYDWFAQQVGSQAVQVTAPGGARYMLSLEGDGVYRMGSGRAGGHGMEVRPTSGGRSLRLPSGAEMDFNAAGNLVAVRDTNQNSIRFQLDANGFVQSVTDPAGRVYSFATTIVQIGRARYTLVTKITDPTGRSIGFSYDASARLTGMTDAAGQTTGYAYDAGGRITQKTDPRGGITQYQYDADGRTVSETLPDGAVYNFAYGVVGGIVTETRVTDPNGNTTTHRFNGQGYEARRIDALGRQFGTEIDYASNQVMSTTDPLMRTTRYTYDAHGNLTSIVDPLGNTTIVEYDQTWNKPNRITDALGQVSTFSYDLKGQLAQAVNAAGETTSFTYTPAGQLESVTDALNHTSRFAYDAEGNLVSSTDPLGNAAQAKYDSANRLIESVNPKGRSTLTSYDVLDRVTQVTDPVNGVTQFTYDAHDNLLSVTDANLHAIETNVYDARNRLTKRTNALNQSETYQYDGAGNLVQVTDRNGKPTTWQYDTLNRPIQAIYPDGRITQYYYDLAGNISRIADNQSGDLVFAYDKLDRLIRITSDQGVIGYSYDVLGRRTQRTINGGDPADYTWDAAGRIKSIAYRGKTVAYTWDAAGRLTGKTLPNGLAQTLQYDAANRLIQLQVAQANGTVLDTQTYTYDANGNRITKTANSTDGTDTPYTATYDAANRLTAITLNPGTATAQSYTLTYDANGNLTTKQNTALALDVTRYTYDGQNRLTGISGPNGTASFKYDALGRRTEKTINGATTGYLYDGDQAIAELQGSTLGATYLTGLQIDEMLARYSNAGEQSYLTDALGSVIAQTDAAGAVTQRYQYSAYGETQGNPAVASADPNPMQYTGRENDGTGLYYYRARYYDPQLKRFIQADPIGLNGGINEYAYVEGNPVNLVDPEGLAPPMRNYNGGNSAQRRYARRHSSPSIPGLPANDNMSEAAGYFNDEGEYVCLRWNCPQNPNQCSKGDTRRHTDFLPAATDPQNPPQGCTCDERRFRPTGLPGTKGVEDYVDAAQKGYKRYVGKK